MRQLFLLFQSRKSSLTSLVSDNENDLISSLKKKLKCKEDEYQTLQNKSMQLEIENGRISREYKKLKDALYTKKKPAKIVRESATRVELRELVSELQDEISKQNFFQINWLFINILQCRTAFYILVSISIVNLFQLIGTQIIANELKIQQCNAFFSFYSLWAEGC